DLTLAAVMVGVLAVLVTARTLTTGAVPVAIGVMPVGVAGLTLTAVPVGVRARRRRRRRHGMRLGSGSGHAQQALVQSGLQTEDGKRLAHSERSRDLRLVICVADDRQQYRDPSHGVWGPIGTARCRDRDETRPESDHPRVIRLGR